MVLGIGVGYHLTMGVLQLITRGSLAKKKDNVFA